MLINKLLSTKCAIFYYLYITVAYILHFGEVSHIDNVKLVKIINCWSNRLIGIHHY